MAHVARGPTMSKSTAPPPLMTASELLALRASVKQTGYRVSVTLDAWLTMAYHFTDKGYGHELICRYLDRYFYVPCCD